MALKLYYGGFGDFFVFTVAEDKQSAIQNIGEKIHAPYLPITAEEISEVDGCAITPNGKNTIVVPDTGIGDLSDGYHTFNELYHHRAVLFSVVCNDRPEIAWKAKLHHDGTMYDGMFIIGIDTPLGPATYHYDLSYWDMFRVKELDRAPEWDGHTPELAIGRIGNLPSLQAAPTLNEKLSEADNQITLRHCKKCDFTCETQGELLKHYREIHPKGD